MGLPTVEASKEPEKVPKKERDPVRVHKVRLRKSSENFPAFLPFSSLLTLTPAGTEMRVSRLREEGN